ncbi:hypothetical protein MesoLjLc_54950 [Mesorhizobium sp. L-8-10]|uniref:hypothetical protein n=1 Tax=Mesorhizobium sp. L-8-10 TaxID=2744523 RepID=UPI001926A25D|nr:hypothetical protein [Mesorhizobium sp. L-8-10]BCH33565.1 hypothetical protein MesoLjLc_54950 [Mesorhizobium sp. L-8-10]
MLAAAILLVPVAARAEQLHAIFNAAEDGTATVAISPCTPEEAGECVYHALTCTPGQWPPVRFSIITGPVEQVAKAMILVTDAWPGGTMKLAGGKTVDLQFTSVHLDANEMDGGWMLTTGISDPTPLFDALTDGSGEGAMLVVGGEAFTLAPEKGDGAKLARFKNECTQ